MASDYNFPFNEPFEKSVLHLGIFVIFTEQFRRWKGIFFVEAVESGSEMADTKRLDWIKVENVRIWNVHVWFLLQKFNIYLDFSFWIVDGALLVADIYCKN